MNYLHHDESFFSSYSCIRKMPMVYVLATKDLDYLKIGKTTSPKQRFINIQSGCPFELHLWIAIRTPNPSFVEKLLHSRFSKFRKNGEWFCLPDCELDGLFLLVKNTNEHIKGVFHNIKNGGLK